MLNKVMPRRNYFLTIFMGYYKHVACIKIFGLMFKIANYNSDQYDGSTHIIHFLLSTLTVNT
jgi:hypothetical protein